MRSSGMIGGLVLVLAGGLGTASGDEKTKVIESLLDESGTSEIITGLQATMDQQLAQQMGNLQGEDAAAFREVFHAAFDPAPLRASIVGTVRDGYDDEKAKATLTWYRSELGSRIRTAEVRAASAEGQAEMLAFAQGLETDPPEPARMELVASLDRGTQASILSAKLLVAMMRGMIGAISAMAPPDEPPPTAAQIDELIESQLSQIYPMIQTQTLLSILFSSRELTTAELQADLAFVESDAGQWFYVHLGNGMLRAMERAGTTAGTHMAAMMQSKLFATSEEWEKLREAALAEGAALGRSTTHSACTEAAFERQAACGDFLCFGKTRTFLEGCLEASPDARSLCAGVPSEDDLAAAIYWRLERCEERGATTSACNNLMGGIQTFCASPRQEI